ncbi:hypothetical protein VIGAN_04023600 [Vigna angularis var. angularis]|uniref:N-acetyltransferase domain-containing protein n=1 Tax=Vigna angularis var. angularis TaxID=157739 RepID=A0A0S3RRB2_PHAAN|nr:hypothetical protein VIGAN_04023600 [Vigna angularis var. angularis]
MSSLIIFHIIHQFFPLNLLYQLSLPSVKHFPLLMKFFTTSLPSNFILAHFSRLLLNSERSIFPFHHLLPYVHSNGSSSYSQPMVSCLLSVTLEAEVTNKGALALYGRLGFIRAKRLFHYYLNGVDAFRLKLLFPRSELHPSLPLMADKYESQMQSDQGDTPFK